MSEIDRDSNVAKEGMRDLKNKLEEDQKKRARKWVITFVVQHFVTIAMIFGGAIIGLLLIFGIGDILGLLDNNTAYAESGFSEYGNNTGYWFPISKENINSAYFVDGNKENGLIAYTTKAEIAKTVITSPMGPRDRSSSDYYTITWGEYEKLSNSEKSRFARSGRTVEQDQHAGIDIGSAKVTGREIIASKSGTVQVKKGGGYGNYIDITHEDGVVTRYAHLASVNVDNKDEVKQGEIIGIMGDTDTPGSIHLHFEIRINGSPVDPLEYLNFADPWPDPVTTSAGQRKTYGSIVYDPEFALKTTPPTDDMIARTIESASTTVYDLCYHCCEKTKDNPGWGRTASGIKLTGGEKIVAADSSFPFGTWLYIEGGGYYMVADRGGAIDGVHFDVFVGLQGDKVGDASAGTADTKKGSCLNAPGMYGRVPKLSNNPDVKVYVLKEEYWPK